MKLNNIALGLPEILLPKDGTDMTKWAVVACDQYTSQPEVWEEIKEIVGDSPSTLNIIYPEVYLEEGNQEERIRSMNDTMKKYLDENVLVSMGNGFVLLDIRHYESVPRPGHADIG